MDFWSHLHRARTHQALAYGLAITISFIALWMRWQLGDRLAGFPFLTFFGAVFLVAIIGGRGPGLLTVVLTAALAKFYLIEPVGSFSFSTESSAIAAAIYVAITTINVLLISALADSQRLNANALEMTRARQDYEAAEQFRVLVQGVRDFAIYMLDPNGLVSSWNSGAEEIKGYSAQEILGKHFSTFYTPADRAAGEPARALATALSEGKYEREAQRVRKDGSLFWASIVIDPIFDDQGHHVGFAKITRDITERKRRELELEDARETAAQAQRLHSLGEFTGGIAHDFNNLMTVIAGAADFLFRHPEVSAEKRNNYLKAILTTSDRATQLTAQLLAFARRQALRPQIIDLSAHLPAFGSMVQRLLGSRINVVVDVPGTECRVEVDPTQLDAALLNTAVNARDAMPTGGSLTIRCSGPSNDPPASFSIEIVDTGVGISAENLKKVFDPFFTTKEVGKGTGLGLSQIHGFAAQAGGRAEIESEVGKGTNVRIVLPATGKSLQEHIEDQSFDLLPPDLSVLVVEDDADGRRFAQTLLEELGCAIRTASNGDDALDLLHRENFDLVFSDVVMPSMSGSELAREIARQGFRVPIVLASGYSDEMVGELPSTVNFIHKPYDLARLRTTLASALQNRAAK